MSFFFHDRVPQAPVTPEKPADASYEQLGGLATHAAALWQRAMDGEKFKYYDATPEGYAVKFYQKEPRTAASWLAIGLYQESDGTWMFTSEKVRPGTEREPHGTLVRAMDVYPISVERPVVKGIEEVLDWHGETSVSFREVMNVGDEGDILNTKQAANIEEAFGIVGA